jgi:hypothetical protein
LREDAMKHEYTEEDYRSMGQIADAAIFDNVKDLAQTLADPNFGPKLIARENPLEPYYRHRLEMLVIGLEYLLDTAKSRLLKP